MKLRMTEDNVLMEVLPHGTTASGVIIPDTATSQPPRFVVRALGIGTRQPDGTIIPPPCAEGDEVFYVGPPPPMLGDGDDGRTYAIGKMANVCAIVIERPRLFAKPQTTGEVSLPPPPNGRPARNRLS